MSDKIRVNITMSKELVDFYQQYADKLGIPRSTAMIIGMSTFKDQQEMLMLSNINSDFIAQKSHLPNHLSLFTL